MRRIACVLVAWLALTGLASAQVSILGETKVEPNKLVRLKADGADPKSGLVWRVYPPTVDKATTGKGLLEFVAAPGAYRVELLAITLAPDGTTVIAEAVASVVVGGEPMPDPKPDPGPKPNPKPIAKAWVVIVEETAEAREGRGKMVTDKDLHGYISGKGWKLRMTDKDVVDANGKTPADLAPYVARAKSKGLPFFCVVDQDGTIRTEGVLPETAADLLDALKKVGG